jgi:hypothetical protein
MRFLVILALFTALPASAQDMSDLFGDALKGGSDINDLKKETDKVKAKDNTKKGLQVKSTEGDEHAKIDFVRVFAANKIKLSKKEGCVPNNPGRKRISYLSFDELPEKSDAFAVCLVMKSKIGREIRVTTRIVDGRNRRVGVGNDVIDFRGKPELHHILDFPELTFKEAGKYFYVVELDGKPVTKMPLFEVKLQGTGEYEVTTSK